MKSLVKKNEDRQRHEALKVEAQRAETEAGKQKGNGGGNGSAEVYFSGKHILVHYRCSIMRASSYIAANVICVYSNKPNKQKEHNQGWHFTKKKFKHAK